MLLIPGSKHPLGDATTIVSIFTDTWIASHSPQSTFTAFGLTANRLAVVLPDALTPERISERYFAVFFFQTILSVALHLEAARPGMPPPLLAPSLPHFDPSSASFYDNYYGTDKPVELGTAAAATPSLSSSSPIRPWLRPRLAGTPLATLSSTTGRAWAGYYTIIPTGGRELPMFLELRSVPPLPDTDADTDADAVTAGSELEPELVYFSGEGHDGVGTFKVAGACDPCTGTVSAIKSYTSMTLWWEWRGMVTPFGMAGTWGPTWDGGWWWIWPREWSPATTRQLD